jgi:thiamine-phosphate pyrophosphorylase
MIQIAPLQYITMDDHGPHALQAARACEGGVRWVQFRSKASNKNWLIREAEEVMEVCESFRATFIVNDHPWLAKELGADGVHLGQDDMDPVAARDLLGERIIGGTANTLEQVQELTDKGVDYVGLGPFRQTTTKENLSPILGIKGIWEISDAVGQAVPLIAIGGILATDVPEILASGAHGVAVASGITRAADPKAAVETYLKQIAEIKFYATTSDQG